jgi:protein-S-isoprenylcysteine O-methyltransferase Ste14
MRDRVSDWIGFLFFLGLAVWTAVRIPGPALLLAPTFAHELFMAVAFLIRDRAKATAPGVLSRAVAYGGTFLMVLFFHAARTWRPEWIVMNPNIDVTATGIMFWIAGMVIALGSIWWLRYSFSIEPEARRLVTSGPYSLARHPIYSGYVVQYVGLWLIYPSVAFGLVLLAWLALTSGRIRFEERVLASAFPEYAKYQQSVGALGLKMPTGLARRVTLKTKKAKGRDLARKSA